MCVKLATPIQIGDEHTFSTFPMPEAPNHPQNIASSMLLLFRQAQVVRADNAVGVVDRQGTNIGHLLDLGSPVFRRSVIVRVSSCLPLVGGPRAHTLP